MKIKKRYLVLTIIIVIIIALGFGINSLIKRLEAGFEELSNLEISEIDLSMVEDGTYVGEYQVFPINVKVEVVVKNHQITEIILIKHDSGKGKPAEEIIDKVVEKQSTNVDYIAGATYSSKVILKAIEIAINK